MLPRPIVILAMPRSGSSMTAGIFANHGVWFGNCGPPRPSNPKGAFENLRIKREQMRRWGTLTIAKRKTAFEREPVCEPQSGFRAVVEAVLERQHYRGGPWGYKQSALYKNAWHEFEPYFVGVRRENVVSANLTRQEMMGTANPVRVQRMVDLHDQIIDECEVIVKTDEIVKGNYSTLREAFEYCGLEFDPKIADEFVDPSLWHH